MKFFRAPVFGARILEKRAALQAVPYLLSIISIEITYKPRTAVPHIVLMCGNFQIMPSEFKYLDLGHTFCACGRDS